MSVAASAVIGFALGLFYGMSSVVTAAIALRQGTIAFMLVYFGGMGLRMLAALLAVAAVLIWTQVNVPVFVTSLACTLIASMVLEIMWLLRRRAASA